MCTSHFLIRPFLSYGKINSTFTSCRGRVSVVRGTCHGERLNAGQRARGYGWFCKGEGPFSEVTYHKHSQVFEVLLNPLTSSQLGGAFQFSTFLISRTLHSWILAIMSKSNPLLSLISNLLTGIASLSPALTPQQQNGYVSYIAQIE